MSSPAHEARAINDIRFAGPDWIQQKWIFLRVVFKIRILHEHYVTARRLKATAQSGAFALIAFVEDNFVYQACNSSFQDSACSITRSIIYDDDLLILKRACADR